MTGFQKWTIGLLSGLLCVAIGFSVYFVKQSHPTAIRKTTTTEVKKVPEKKTDSKLAQAKLALQQYDYPKAKQLLAKEKGKEAEQLNEKMTNEQEQVVDWKDPEKISHLFFHSLIVDPQKAFHDKEQAKGYKDYMVTITEFNKSIQQLYDRGYVLVDFEDLLTKKDGKLQFQGVSLPEGKKPLILSQDDVSYYEYMKGAGFADKLLLTKDGKVKNSYTVDGKTKIGDYDMVPLLDTFVQQHPDFSYRGTKGVLAITGYNGALGYRTSKSEYGDTAKTDSEIKQAKKVAQRLKQTGWTFASHTWGHLNLAEVGMDNIRKDTQLWQKEVAPILGDTDVLIYPHGADISDFRPYDKNNEKFNYLRQQGFDIFCNVDASVPAWGQFTPDYYRSARINVDGIRFESDLDGENKVLKDFIDVKKVYDPARDK